MRKSPNLMLPHHSTSGQRGQTVQQANRLSAQFIVVDSLSQVLAARRIPVHLFLRITEKFEEERPHVQSCAGEAETYSQNPKKKGRIDVGRYPVQAQDLTR
jgi:hypothetical protein